MRIEDPELRERATKAVEDLEALLKKMRKAKDIGMHISSVNATKIALELVLKYGSNGGKVPSPIRDEARVVFRAHQIEELIHPAWTPRHRG